MNTWYEPGHVAIVTGGSQGLGKEVVRSLLQRGLSVITDGRDAEKLQTTVAELAGLGELTAIIGDVADRTHVHTLVDTAKKRYGRLDLLINNASTLGETPLPLVKDLSPQTLTRTFDVNLFAPIHLIQHALPLLITGGSVSTIVTVTSDAGVEAYPGWGAYGASKAALEHISRILAAELEGTHVRVLVADPGDMDTTMHRAAIPDADPTSLRNPRDVAEALLDAISNMQKPFERLSLKVAEDAHR